MIRRLFLISLALAGIATASAGVRSYFVPMCAGSVIEDRDWLGLHVFDGRMRIFWFHSKQRAIQIEQLGARPALLVVPRRAERIPPMMLPDDPIRPLSASPQGNRSSEHREAGWFIRQIAVESQRISIGDRRQVPPFGYAWRTNLWARTFGPPVHMSFVRFPVWLPVALMVVPPTVAVIRGPMTRRRRRKRNQCRQCGYQLTGNVSGICPECGTEIEKP